VSGILVPAGDIPALARAIASLVQNDERRARLARQGLESVGRFAPDEILNRWEALFRSLTDQRMALQDVHSPTPAGGRT
jgi:glycosyltransferase involved in cell wall biosynthesis